MSMTPEQYIRAMREMIETDGWRIYKEECEKEIYHLQADALEAKDWDEILVNRGRAQQLAETCALEDVIENQNNELLEMTDASISV
ncbi:MAG: hypothetical protein ACXABY_26240 [Candidatus Thorarchaeota archaeon]